MYEDYSRISLPSKYYRELLGSSICVFNLNNSFIIENLINDTALKLKWHDLIDMTSGSLKKFLTPVFYNRQDIINLFSEIVSIRNRIIHSFRITYTKEEMGDYQILATKNKDGTQSIIDESFLLDFITKNNSLNAMLYEFRDQNPGPLS